MAVESVKIDYPKYVCIKGNVTEIDFENTKTCREFLDEVKNLIVDNDDVVHKDFKIGKDDLILT